MRAAFLPNRMIIPVNLNGVDLLSQDFDLPHSFTKFNYIPAEFC